MYIALLLHYIGGKSIHSVTLWMEAISDQQCGRREGGVCEWHGPGVQQWLTFLVLAGRDGKAATCRMRPVTVCEEREGVSVWEERESVRVWELDDTLGGS